ncbi:MAG: GNAT family N-acetyltransferase [Nocardioidaceae bacterium]
MSVGPDGESDLELLLIEIGVLWGRDARGRYEEPPRAVIAVCENGMAVVSAPDVPDPLSDRLHAIVEDPPGTGRPGVRPPAADLCRTVLASADGPLEMAGGPSYYAEPPLSLGTDLTLLVSTNPADVGRLSDARPDSWEPDEWRELLAGRLGPWAMLADDECVVTICHSPRESATGVEAGVWTEPQYRGQGHAAAATAAWANLMTSGRRRHLFYSTSQDNRSSQRVAERLGLHEIGWLWKVAAPGCYGAHSIDLEIRSDDPQGT